MVTKSAEQPLSDSVKVDTDPVFLYLTEARYLADLSSDILKRAIRRKAAVCVVTFKRRKKTKA